MPHTMIFWFGRICNFQTSGTGTSRMITSVVTLAAALYVSPRLTPCSHCFVNERSSKAVRASSKVGELEGLMDAGVAVWEW